MKVKIEDYYSIKIYTPGLQELVRMNGEKRLLIKF